MAVLPFDTAANDRQRPVITRELAILTKKIKFSDKLLKKSLGRADKLYYRVTDRCVFSDAGYG